MASDSTDPSLTDALRDNEAVLDEMRAKFEAHKAVVEAQQADLALEDEQVHRQASIVNSLRIALEKYAGGEGAGLATPTATVDPYISWWETATRTDAIVKALEMLDKPVGPTTIADFLHHKGRQDKVAAISATLNYLAQENRVWSVGYAQWTTAKVPRHPVMEGLASETRRRVFGAPQLPPERGAPD